MTPHWTRAIPRLAFFTLVLAPLLALAPSVPILATDGVCTAPLQAARGSVRLDTLGCPSFLDTRIVTHFYPVEQWTLTDEADYDPPTIYPGLMEARFIATADKTGHQRRILELEGTLIVTNTGSGNAITVSYVANLQRKGPAGFYTVLTIVDDESTGMPGQTTICDPDGAGAVTVPFQRTAVSGGFAILDKQEQDVIRGYPGCDNIPPSDKDNPITSENESCKGAPVYRFLVDFPLENLTPALRSGEVLRLEILGTYRNSGYQGNQGAQCFAGLNDMRVTIPARFNFSFPSRAVAAGAAVEFAYDNVINDPPDAASLIDDWMPDQSVPIVWTGDKIETVRGSVRCERAGEMPTLTNSAYLRPPSDAGRHPYFTSLYLAQARDTLVLDCGGTAGEVGPVVDCAGYFTTYAAQHTAHGMGYGQDPGWEGDGDISSILWCFVNRLHRPILDCDPWDSGQDGYEGLPPCGVAIGEKTAASTNPFAGPPYVFRFSAAEDLTEGGKLPLLIFLAHEPFFPDHQLWWNRFFGPNNTLYDLIPQDRTPVAGEALALTLNVEFSDRMVFDAPMDRMVLDPQEPCWLGLPGALGYYGSKTRLGDLHLCAQGTELEGSLLDNRRVREILALANAWLDDAKLPGDPIGSSTVTPGQLANAMHLINTNFLGGRCNYGWLCLPKGVSGHSGEVCPSHDPLMCPAIP